MDGWTDGRTKEGMALERAGGRRRRRNDSAKAKAGVSPSIELNKWTMEERNPVAEKEGRKG